MEEVMREEGRETPPAPKKKRGPRLGKKKKWLVLVLVLAVAAIAAVKLLGGRESEAAVNVSGDGGKAGHHPFPQLQRHPGARGLLYRQHPGIRRDPLRYL